MRFLPQRFNDTLALLLLAAIGGLWLQASLPDAVLGATIAWGGMIVAFYFRKAPPPGGER